MKVMATEDVKFLTGWQQEAISALAAQGVSLDFHRAVEGLSNPRRAAHALAKSAAGAEASGILTLDRDILRCLCGNASYRGRLVTLVDGEALAHLETRHTPAFTAAILDACAIVVAPSHVATQLVASKAVLPGKVFVYDDAESDAGLLLNASPLVTALNERDRIRFALAQTRIVTDVAGSDGAGPPSASRVRFGTGTGPESVAVLRLPRRNAGQSPSRSAWQLRQLLECHGIRLVLTEDLDIATYAGSHPDLSTLVVPVLQDVTARVSDTSDPVLDGLVRATRWLGVGSESDRRDVEISRPAFTGRVIVVPCTNTADAELADIAERIGPPAPRRSASRLTRVILAGHDLKFAGALIEEMTRRGDVAIGRHNWENQYQTPDGLNTEELRRADVVWVEFAAGPAAWYAKRKRPGQRLIVRVHGYEVRGPWGDEIDWRAVDVLVCVSEHVRDAAVARWGLPAAKAIVLPNSVEPIQLHRPKHPEASFTLGLMGWTPALKRLDRAIALVDRLRAVDNRFQLVVKGSPLTREGWIWSDVVQRRAYEALFHHLRSNPGLAKHVRFEPFGGATAHWLQQIGWILSPSDTESFHLACMEGMASGAVPIIWDREGASTIYPQEFIVGSTNEAVQLASRGQQEWPEMSQRAMDSSAPYDPVRTRSSLAAVLALPPAY